MKPNMGKRRGLGREWQREGRGISRKLRLRGRVSRLGSPATRAGLRGNLTNHRTNHGDWHLRYPIAVRCALIWVRWRHTEGNVGAPVPPLPAGPRCPPQAVLTVRSPLRASEMSLRAVLRAAASLPRYSA